MSAFDDWSSPAAATLPCLRAIDQGCSTSLCCCCCCCWEVCQALTARGFHDEAVAESYRACRLFTLFTLSLLADSVPLIICYGGYCMWSHCRVSVRVEGGWLTFVSTLLTWGLWTHFSCMLVLNARRLKPSSCLQSRPVTNCKHTRTSNHDDHPHLLHHPTISILILLLVMEIRLSV